MSLLTYFITMTFALLLLSACTTLEVGVEQTPGSSLTTPTLNPSPAVTAGTQLTTVPSPPVDVGIPQPGVLYLGYGGTDPSPVLFYRSPASAEEPDLGEVLYLDRQDWGHFYVSDFQQLSQPRAVFTAETDLSLYSGRETGKWLYASFSVERLLPCSPAEAGKPLPPCPTKAVSNHVIAIDRSTLAWREIWTNELYDNTYTASDTAALIDQAVDPFDEDGQGFLVLRVAPCCDGVLSQPHVMLVVNVATGQEVFLGEVGNVNLDLIDQVVSYQKLGTQRLKCGPDRVVGCDQDGYWTRYEPTGELLKQPLP